MVEITNTTQLNVFSMIRTVLMANTTLSTFFNFKDYYLFETNEKNEPNPAIIIKIPLTEDLVKYLGNTTDAKLFKCPIMLSMDYSAKDNAPTICSNILSALRGGQTTYQASGYNLSEVNVTDEPSRVDLQNVKAGFDLILSGEVKV